jgi:DNA-binding transcriptional MocR family regulator
MNPGPTFDRVYVALKQKILDASFPPGARINPADLTDDLASSVMPIRDALHRLTGEGLVLAVPALGFRMPLLTEPALGDLYEWMEELLLLALASPLQAIPEQPLPITLATDPAAATAQLFNQLAPSSGSRELNAAIQNANDRLHAVRRAEEAVIDGLSAELETIERDWWRGDGPALRDRIRHYHQRRQTVKGLVLDRMIRGSHRVQ